MLMDNTSSMLVNRFEKLLMNNPLRVLVQHRIEAPTLLRLGGPVHGGAALEVGCGRGVGVQLILDTFRAARVDAFDLDPNMVHQAERRLRTRKAHVRLWVGDARAVAAPDNTYDAVFDFGAIHHVPAWTEALGEIYRVLRPGGRLYAEEVLDRFILHPLTRALFDHPLENRFDAPGFVGGLQGSGFQLLGQRAFGKYFAWFVAEKPRESRS